MMILKKASLVNVILAIIINLLFSVITFSYLTNSPVILLITDVFSP